MEQTEHFIWFCVLLALVAFPSIVSAQGADDCEDATSISDGDFFFSTVGASTDGPGPANCSVDVDTDIWFNYTATCTGFLTASTCNQVNYDSALAVYSTTDCPADSGASEVLGCGQGGPDCGLTAIVTVPVTAGGEYKIQVGGFNGASGFGTLSVSCALPPPTPANDDCINATDLTGPLPVTVDGQNISATQDTTLVCGTNDTGDVHYTFTPTANILLLADTCQSMPMDIDTALQIWDGGADCSAITGGTAGGTCNDDFCGPSSGFASSVQVAATGGVEYTISVQGWNGVGYNFSLTLAEGIPVPFPEECDISVPGVAEVTQSMSQEIVPGNSVACGSGGATTDNGYMRIFDFAVDGVTGTIEILAVEIGIEVAVLCCFLDTQPATVRIYDFTGIYETDVEISASELVEISSQEFSFPEFAGPGIQCLEFDSPVLVNTFGLNDIAVEVDLPNNPGAASPSFFIGSNPDGQSRQSYLRSASCSVPNPTPIQTLGFPDMHIVMNVHYVSVLPGYLRGDSDGDGVLNPLADALHLLTFGFLGGSPPPCLDAADVDGNGASNPLADGTYLLSFGFLSGPPPPAPFPICEPGDEVLGCIVPSC